MGFFRFRRSIKLFPGVRWNIGKKSSSLSFGGPGAHYTVGSSGTRATVGIPGTGLSYTEFHSAHRRVAVRHPRIPVPSESWFNSHKIDKTIHFPDRRPDEPPIRPDQLDQLQSLPHVDFKGYDLSALGCDQADQFLEQIRFQQKEYTKIMLKKFYAEHGHAIPDDFIDHCYDHPGEPWKSPRSKGHGCLLLLGILFLIGWLHSLSRKEESAAVSSPSVHTSPSPSQTSKSAGSSSPAPAGLVHAPSTSPSSNSQFPAPRFWPKQVRISVPVVLSGTVGGGTISETAKAGEVLDATLSPDHKSVILRRLDISGSLPIGDTDFMERAKKPSTGL